MAADADTLQSTGTAPHLKRSLKLWHLIVYGIALAAFNLPLRQGLIHYAERTIARWAGAAIEPSRITASDQERILNVVLGKLPASLSRAMTSSFENLRLLD